MSVNSANGNSIGSRYMSNNTSNWSDQFIIKMIINSNKIFATYVWIKRGLIVFDTSSNLFSESYEYSSTINNMNWIIIFNSRLFYFGWDTSTNRAIISSAKLGNLSLIPDISTSNFGMNIIVGGQYTISSNSITD